MSILIIHNEQEFFGGAEKMLIYFSQELASRKIPFWLALAPGSKLDKEIGGSPKIHIPQRRNFSIGDIVNHAKTLNGYHKKNQFEIVHGWAVRDWELASVLGKKWKVPSMGTLHDHPKSLYLSKLRQFLMKTASHVGLEKIVCVSEAVKSECQRAGFSVQKMECIHNGIMFPDRLGRRTFHKPLRIGFLGNLSPGKGLDGLFEVVRRLDSRSLDICVEIAGGASTPGDLEWVDAIKRRYATEAWAQKFVWHGWIGELEPFFNKIDLLFFSSRMFDSFPTVLLEAARYGVPVLASAIGGAPEIVVHNKTGWLFGPEQWSEASQQVEKILQDITILKPVSDAAQELGREKFSLNKMVDNYLNMYTNLKLHV